MSCFYSLLIWQFLEKESLGQLDVNSFKLSVEEIRATLGKPDRPTMPPTYCVKYHEFATASMFCTLHNVTYITVVSRYTR